MPSAPPQAATGLIAFDKHVAGGLRVVAHELAHEQAGKHTCDKRLARGALAAQFGAVDFALLETEDDPYWGDGRTREPLEVGGGVCCVTCDMCVRARAMCVRACVCVCVCVDMRILCLRARSTATRRANARRVCACA